MDKIGNAEWLKRRAKRAKEYGLSELEYTEQVLMECLHKYALLMQENETLRADARRYQFLRKLARDIETGEPVGNDFDAAVDEKLRMALQ